MTINENSLALSFAGKLAEKGHTVVYPKLLLFPPSPAEVQTEKSFRHSLQTLVNARDDANQAVRALATKVAVASQRLSELQKTHPHDHKRRDSATNEDITSQQQQLIKDRLQLEACQKWFTGLDDQFQAMLKALNVPDAKGVVPLQMLQIAQALLERFEKAPQDTYFFRAEVASAGGSYRIRRNLFRSLFWSDGLSYSGGVIVSYAFLNSEAAVVKSGTHHYRYPFNRFRDAWWSKTFGNSFEDTELSDKPAIPQTSFLVLTNQAIELEKKKKAAGKLETSSLVLTNQAIEPKDKKDVAGKLETSSVALTNQGLDAENKSKDAK